MSNIRILCRSVIVVVIWNGFSALATVYNSDGSAASVQGLHNVALNGDTITLPVGTFTWATGVTISKGITLQGAGSGSTIINRAASYTGNMISITGLTSDLAVRVTGIRFDSSIGQGSDRTAIYVKGTWGAAWGYTKIRVDNCYFEGGQRNIFFQWRSAGVVDHCTFHNTAIPAFVYGEDDLSWNRSMAFGTSDAVFFEDDTFAADGAISFFDTLGDSYVGGKYVFRHCTFDLVQFAPLQFGSLISSHGNQAYWQPPGGNNWNRGGVMCEFYENQVHMSSVYRVLWFRGGRNIVANNTFTTTQGGIGAMVAFSEEEPSRFGRNSGWPAEDQINATFIWGNTVNGQQQTASMVSCWDTPSATFVQAGRDYWLQAPSASTTTSYPHPAAPSDPNYPLPYAPVTSWTPYTYPHPLATGQNPSPTPSASPTATATSTPTPTASPTATPSPSSTPSASPTATATSTPTPTASPTATPTPWSTPSATPGAATAIVADFDGDGHTDWVVRHVSTNITVMLYLNDNVVIGANVGPTLPAGWGTTGAADFDTDSHPDFGWFNSYAGLAAIWYLNNNVFIGSAVGPILPAGWALVATADFNGDGKPDYVVYHAASRITAIVHMNNNVVIDAALAPTLPAGSNIVGVADFDGDGHPDYALFNPNTGTTAIWYLNDNVFLGSAAGLTLPIGWLLVATADFNGDGKPDYVVYHAGYRITAIVHMNNNVAIDAVFGPTLPAGWTLTGP